MGNVNERECITADGPPSPCPTHDDGEGPSSPVLVVIEETLGHPSDVKHHSHRLVAGDESHSLETFEPPKAMQEEEEKARMHHHEHQDHAIDTIDASRDDSLPLSDSVIPASFEFSTEASPEFSSGSDIFHTPEVSQLDIEGSQSSGEPLGFPTILESDASMLKVFGTCAAVQAGTCPAHSDLDSKEFQADATDSDIFEYIPRGLDSDDPPPESQAHPLAPTALLDDHNKLDSGPKGPVLAQRCIEKTDPLTEKLEAKSEEIMPKLAVLIHARTLETTQGQVTVQEESRHLVSEPIAPPQLNDVVDIASHGTPDAKSVPDKVVPLNVKSQTGFPSSEPRHTAEKPNWALAPDDPPKPRTTLRKKGERGHGARRGKRPNGDSSPESIPPPSAKASHINRRRSKPNTLVKQATPVQNAMGLNVEKHSSTLLNTESKNLPYLPMFRVTEEKLSPSGKRDSKESPLALETERRTPDTKSVYGLQVSKQPGAQLEPVRESSTHNPSLPRLTQGSPTSVDLAERSRSSSASINAFETSDKRSLPRSPPWRRKSALLTIVESATKTLHEIEQCPSMNLYRSFPPSEETKLKGMGEKKGLATKEPDSGVAETAISESHKRCKPEDSSQDRVPRLQPDSTLARGVRKVGRLSWPSSEEDLKLHKTAPDREPLPWRSKANNQAFSRPYVPAIPSAPLLPPRPNQSAATSSKETLNLGTQNNSFHAEGRALVNLPSKPMQMQPQDPVTSLGNDSVRLPFSSNIPIPTRTQNRSGSIPDGPSLQARVDAMDISGLETQERTFAPPGGLALTHRPKLPRPGHIYRSASQTFVRQDLQVGNSVLNPTTNPRQEFHGLQYYSLAGHQPTPAIILPMPNDTSRPPVPPIPRSRPDYPFPELAHVHNYQVNRACPQGPETATYTGITQPPTTALVGRLHRSTSLYGGWRERHGLGLSQQVSGMPNARLHSHNTNDSATMLAPRGFPNTLQRSGNAPTS